MYLSLHRAFIFCVLLPVALDAGERSEQSALLRSSKLASPQAAAAGSLDDYRIGAGDVLQVVVWREPEASAETTVRGDGKITLPIIKELNAAGLTPAELETILAAKYSKVITEPDVTVVAKQINSRKVYMMGAVRKEGPLPLVGRTTVLQAINEAGGLNDYAKRKKIYILRGEGSGQLRIPFDYEAALKGEHVEQNIRLLPGDSVVVPQ